MANYAIYSGAKEYARSLPGTEEGFRGVDLSSNPANVSKNRFSWLQNMWRDYHSESGIATETIPGFRMVHDALDDDNEGLRINGLFGYKTPAGEDFLVIHAGTEIRLIRHENRDAGTFITATGSVADHKSRAFTFNGKLYLLDGTDYYVLNVEFYDGGGIESATVSAVDGYLPLVYLNGSRIEQRNLLNDYVSEISDGEAYAYTASVFAGATIRKDIEVADGNYLGAAIADEMVALKSNQINEKSAEAAKPEDPQTSETLTCIVFQPQSNNFIIPAIGNGWIDIANKEGAYPNKWMDTGKYPNLQYLFFDMEKSKYFDLYDNVGNFTKSYTLCFSYSEADFLESFIGSNSLTYLPPQYAKITENKFDKIIGIKIDVSGVNNVVYSGTSVSVGLDASSDFYFTFEDGDIRLNKGTASTGEYAFSCDLILENGATVRKFFRVSVGHIHYEESEYEFGVDCSLKQVFVSEDAKEAEIENGRYYYKVTNIDGTSTSFISVGDGFPIKYKPKNRGNTFDGYDGTDRSAIAKCTICEPFDDRIFLSGNPDLPNTIFYCGRNDDGVIDPTYFGVYNYINDGNASGKINGLLSAGTTLLALKDDVIYYHQGADSSDDIIPRIYPASRGATGVGGVGATMNFYDDPVFLTKRGLDGISKETLTLERTVGHRSKLVDAALLREDLANAEMVEWDGYLCIFAGGHVYMADSRQMFADEMGNAEYEWYYLCDIGDSHPITQYHTVSGTVTLAEGEVLENDSNYWVIDPEDASGHIQLSPFDGENEESIYAEEVHTQMVVCKKIGNIYVPIDGIDPVDVFFRDGFAYLAEANHEKVPGGVFAPAEHPCVIDGVLYFSATTDDDVDDIYGRVFCVNTDKRGVAYDHYYDIGHSGIERGDFVEPVAHDKIHRRWYNFNGVRIDARASTCRDDCGIPYFNKTIVKNSFVLRAKVLDSGGITIRVMTDGNPVWREVKANNAMNYFDNEYGNTDFNCVDDQVFTLRVKEKKWHETQFCFFDGGFEKPFGIYSMAYRYFIAGNIRK